MQSNKKLVSIDPGYDRCGVAVFALKEKPELIFSSCIKTNKKDAHPKRLSEIYFSINELFKKHKPEVVAVESLFFSMNKKTAIKVAEARGVILCLAANNNIEVLELSPQKIKLSLTGVGNSDKKSVQKMVSSFARIDTKKLIDDEIDAIAIGLTALEEIRLEKKFGDKFIR